jgi:hypothetical protein
MKRKNAKLRKSLATVVIIGITAFTSIVYGQGNTWKLTGNNNVGNNDFIGSTNKSDFIIKTNNKERIRVTTDDYTIIKDSVRILGPLFIGDSSLILGIATNIPGPDLIRSTNGVINFGNTMMLNFSNIRIGIGLTAPQHKLHINDRNQFIFGQPNPVFSAYTNQAFGSGTGATATDGFLVGIAADGTAELRQQENRAIRIFTNDGMLNNQRMIITHSDDVANLPRVGIGREDLLNPRTFLHIGQDIDFSGFGYRDWMNVGELVVDEKGSNMYFGFSRNGHIINWGSEHSLQNDNRLRFVNTTGDIMVQSGSPVGIEIACMISDGENGFMGIGNFSGNLEPTQTLDVTGNARLRELDSDAFHDETLTKCVVVDDDGVLHWRNFTGGGPGTSLGNECDGPITNPLGVDWEIPLDEYNFIFSGQFPNKSRVGIGIDGCQPTAKLDVLMNPGEINCITIKGVNEGFLAANGVSIGIYGDASNSHSSIGVCGVASNSHISTGVYGKSESFTSFKNNGGYFTADGATYNYGGYFETFSSNPNTINNYGVYAVCPHEVTGAPGNWAGYFVGNVHVEGNITATGSISDQQFKQDIVDYNGALGKIRDLRPVNFYFDTVNYNLNFPTDMQYGLIAQEVETVLPELVSNQIIPEKFDTAGNIISEVIHYKGLEYGQLTPILVQAVKELDSNLTEIVRIPEPPVLISPENNDTIYGGGNAVKASSFSGIFTWHAAEDALCYIADYSYSPDMSEVFTSQVAFDTVLKMGFAYEQDTVVYWAVRSLGAFGISEYSEIRYFNLQYTFGDDYIKSVSELSDITLKTNIHEIEDALTKTMLLQGVSFEWDIANNPGRNLSEGTNLGLIAQAVQPIFPEVVNSDSNGILYIDYSSLIPVLVESVKELKYINDSLNESVNMLESRLDNLEQFVFDNLGEIEAKTTKPVDFQQEVVLENKMAIVLNQNVPNPFKENTTISFQIPETVKEAKIVFIDNLGNILKQVEIQERGYGELLVYAYDLSAGHYTYYLVADGITIESKKMVLTK